MLFSFFIFQALISSDGSRKMSEFFFGMHSLLEVVASERVVAAPAINASHVRNFILFV